VCAPRLGGAFEGSPELRFEPGPVQAGEYRAELLGSESATLLAQTFLPVLAFAGESRIEVVGGTHLPQSPSTEYLGRHWRAAVEPLGFDMEVSLVKAGFGSTAAGELRGRVGPRRVDRPRLLLESRGDLVAVRGISAGGRLRRGEAERQRDAAQARLWEARRLETEWALEEVPTASPGAFLFLEAVFENGRGAFAFRTERGVRPEILGDRAARRLLAFLETEACVDPQLADQLAVPLALAGRGGRVRTSAVTAHLRTVARVVSAFGVPATVSGRSGGPGILEVG
jgi:RNA 3'-terminal phosphate cyclase (ATP)